MSIYKMNRDQVMKFVELYKSSECLWDASLPEYKERSSRDRAMKHISDQMQIVGFGPKEVAQKIKNIRTGYKQELNKIVSTQNSSFYIYKPRVPWFECADSFLNSLYSGSTYNEHDKLQTQMERFNSPATASSQDEEEVTEVEQLQRINSVPVQDAFPQGNSAKSCKLNISDHSRSSCTPESFENRNQIRKIARKRSTAETEFDLWARSLAIQLNDMNVCRALRLQLQIQTLVTNERLEYESSEATSNLQSLPYGYGQFNRVDWQLQDATNVQYGQGLYNTNAQNPSSSTHPRMPSPTFASESIEIKMSPVSLDDEDTL